MTLRSLAGRHAARMAATAATILPMLAAVAGAQGTVRGTVVDSLASGAPLAGAIVQLAPASSPGGGRTAITDALGAFRFDSIAPGRYHAGFFHPKLDSLGLQMPVRSVDVTSGGTLVHMSVPSAATIVASVCKPAPGGEDASGLLLGTVRDARSGAPLAGSSAEVGWMELVISNNSISREMQRLPTATGELGTFAVCGVPSDTPVQLSAVMGADSSGFAEVQVPPRGLLHRDVYLARVGVAPDTTADAPGAMIESRPARNGTAVVVGTTVSDEGEPIAGALVADLRSGAADTSDARGGFRLNALPPGTTTIEARAIGYRPARQSVDARSGRRDSVRVTFAKKVDAVLDRVIVYGEQGNNWDRDAFMRRMHSGSGTYLGLDEIEKRHAFAVTDLLRGIPGVRIYPSRGGETIRIRGCTPTVFLDGIPVSGGASTIRDIIAPVDIGGVEVYRSGAFTPPEFAAYGNGCGVVALWTRYQLMR